MAADHWVLVAHCHRDFIRPNIVQHIQGIPCSILHRIVSGYRSHGADIQRMAAIGQHQCHHVVVARIAVNDYRDLFHCPSSFLLQGSLFFLRLLFPVRSVDDQPITVVT